MIVPDAPPASPPVEVVRRLPAAEAHQGVAAGRRSIYAVANSAVGRYDRASGRLVARWQGDPARFPHLNSCIVRGRALVCASSNFPAVSMNSQVLWIDARSMTLKRVRPLGHADGSLTWIDWHGGAWWAAFANYDGHGGEPGRDHRATALVRYSPDFTVEARWRFPDAVLDRFAPNSASGGAWGRDGLLYVAGHDRPELYAFRVPPGGGTLALVATLPLATPGQAFGWDPAGRRLLWSIDRKASELVESRIPAAD